MFFNQHVTHMLIKNKNNSVVSLSQPLEEITAHGTLEIIAHSLSIKEAFLTCTDEDMLGDFRTRSLQERMIGRTTPAFKPSIR